MVQMQIVIKQYNTGTRANKAIVSKHLVLAARLVEDNFHDKASNKFKCIR